MKARNSRHVVPPPQPAGSVAPYPLHARPVRFRLRGHSPRDQAIAQWLDAIPAYHRAEAIRCALYDHLRELTAPPQPSTPSQHIPSSRPPDAPLSAAREHAATAKLRRMF